MSETGFLAILAVAGTFFGAAISPVISLLRDTLTARANTKSERLKAAAQFGQLLIEMANASPDVSEDQWVRQKKAKAVEGRFALATYLPRGSGQVDRFAEHSIALISGMEEQRPRLFAAEHAAAAVLSWARGDRAPRTLGLFEVDKYAGEFLII